MFVVKALGGPSLAQALGIESEDDEEQSANMDHFDYNIVQCSALLGTGVLPAFTWLSERLKTK